MGRNRVGNPLGDNERGTLNNRLTAVDRLVDDGVRLP
jgi:hypothetical protein